MRFDPEQLYFFKLVLVMFYMEELLQLWKEKLWDPSKAFLYFNCAEFRRGKSPTRNDEERELCNHGTSKSCQEQKHTDLYEASLKEETNDDESLQELPVNAPPNGIRHDHVQCRSRNLVEMKVASAEGQSHLLRNKDCFEAKAEMIKQDTFEEKVNDDESLQELPVKAPPNGIRHDHVQCRSRNQAEMKVASAEGQFHLLRNKDCFEAKAEVIKEDTFEEKVNDDESLQELPVKAPPNGIRHDHFQCWLGNQAGNKVALAEDQFHLLRNKVCVELKAELIKKDAFDTLIEKTKHTFNMIEKDTSRIDEIVEMGEEDFPADKIQLLREKLEEERSCAKQSQKGNPNKFKSGDDSSNSWCASEEGLNKTMLSFTSEASSLNSVPSPSASEEAAGELTENTYQEDYASSRPLSDSSAELQADFYEMSSYEEGLLSKENHLDTESVAVKDSLEQRDQEFKQRRQPNCMCARHQSNDIVAKQLQVKIEDLLHKLDQLQAENIFYVDRCLKQEEEITRLKENLTQIEEEKQGLESEVGRQLFLEGKNKRHSKLYQPFTEHCGEQIMPNTASGASFDVTGLDGEQLDVAGPCDNSGLLQFLIQEILLSNSELSRIKVLVRPKVDSERLSSIRKGSELFKELECRGELSCSYVKCLLEKIDRSDLAEKLVAYNRDGLFKRDDYSPQEGNQWCKASEIICGVDNRTSNEVEESRKISNGADIDEEVHDGNHNSTSSSFCHSNDSNDFVDIYKADSPSRRCGFASSCSQSSSSSAVNMQSLTKDSHCGASTIKLNPDHHALKTWKNSGESAFDITNGEEEKQERSVSLLLTDGCLESEEEKRRGASKEEGGKDGCGNSTSICDGAVNASYLIPHCNTVDVVDGPGCTSSRAPDSLKLKNISDVSHVSLPPEGMPRKQNVSSGTATAQKNAVLVQPDSCTSNQLNTWEHAGARPKNATQKQNVLCPRITTQKDSAVDQSDSYKSSKSIEFEHLGGRQGDRTPKGESSLDSSSSLFSSLVDLVPQQVGEPVVQGVVNAFLAKHSEDKHLHESLYYNNAEEMLAKDMGSMMNMFDSNKAKPYLDDCQAAAMSDPYYQPYSSAFPLPSEAYIGEDGFPLDYTFNGNSVLPPGPSSSYIGASMSQNSYFNSLNPNIGSDFALDTSEPQLLQNGRLTSLQGSDFLQSGFTSAGLTSDFLGTTGPQMTHSVIGTQSNISFTGSTSVLPPEPLQMQTPSTTNVGLLASSAGSTPIYGNQANASTGLPTSSSVARTYGSNSRLLSEVASSGNTHLSPFSSIRDGVNTSGHRNSSSILNTIGDHLASGTYREGNSAGDSSSSCLTSTANTGGDHDQSSAQSGGSVSNENYGTESVESTDNSLLELEQRVEEACAMVERVLREREEREEFGREIERKEREIRAERARKKREREARELEEARGWPQQQEPVTGQSLWLCEHYQRHCRVRFPCCTNFYSCHRCHNNSKECENEEAKASHATHLKCSYCHHEQEIAEDSAKCRSCGAKMSAYFCGICKHFTSIDKNPYHCDKCGICRIHKDKSFHCDVCNVCLDKRLQGKHKCRPDSGHDECCICLEDAFSGCQILPCSHKVHRECAIAMIQNGIRTCPVCRHPLYSPAPE